MKESVKKLTGRRSFLTETAANLGAGFWADETLDAALQNTHTASKPSDLKITDVRMAAGAADDPAGHQPGHYGYGENRDGARHELCAGAEAAGGRREPLQHRQDLPQDQAVRWSRPPGRRCGGIEMALWDLAGKAYNVPMYQMLGGKFRDRIRIYCDTPGAADRHDVQGAHEAPHRGRLHLL